MLQPPLWPNQLLFSTGTSCSQLSWHESIMWASGNVAQFPSELMSPRGADVLYKRKWMNWCRHSGVRETVIHHRQGGPSIINGNSLKFYQKLTIQHFLWMHFPFGDVCVCVCFKIGVILNIHQTLLIGKCNCWVEKCYICRRLVAVIHSRRAL